MRDGEARNGIRTLFSTEMCVSVTTGTERCDAWKERERGASVVAFSAAARVCQSAFCELLSASFCRSRSCPATATAMRQGGPRVRSAWLDAAHGRSSPKERPGRRVDTATPQVAKSAAFSCHPVLGCKLATASTELRTTCSALDSDLISGEPETLPFLQTRLNLSCVPFHLPA